MAQASCSRNGSRSKPTGKTSTAHGATRSILAHDVPLIGQTTGRVKAVSGTTITTDEVIYVTSTSLGIRFRSKDGTSNTFLTSSALGEIDTFNIVGPGPYLPEVGDLFMVGPYTLKSAPMRVLLIEPSDNFNAKITLVDDAPGIDIADTQPIPPYNSHISDPIDPLFLAPLSLGIQEYLYVSGGTVRPGLI